MRLTFAANKWLGEYHGPEGHFRPGDSADVPDEAAQGLMRDFPENFKSAEAVPAQDKSFDGPPADKMLRRGGRRSPVKVK